MHINPSASPRTNPAINHPPTTDHPLLIAGAGLAGCVLARQFEARRQPFLLVGDPARASAADVAAGIINPVTGRWMTKSWRIDAFAPEARDFYRSLERDSGRSLYHPIGITRFCLNPDDVKRAGRRLRNPRYASVLGSFQAPGNAGADCADPHGSLRISGGAWVDLPAVLAVLRTRYRNLGGLLVGDFNHRALQRVEGGWRYAGRIFRGVIFCEGAALPANPWFGHLPLQPAKGETLLCHSNQFKLPDKILHHDKWILPDADGHFRLGATYDDADPTPEPTGPARRQLLDAFKKLFPDRPEPTVLKHLAGHRPGTADARPLLGAHPTESGLYLLNGLGSKGASLAPTLSRELCEFLLDGKALDPEADLRRFDRPAPYPAKGSVSGPQ
ncbi:MAG: NAD(P)/FAD-dependent oxidoreductase [Opitutales bacterium]